MFTDMTLSSDINEKFKAHLVHHDRALKKGIIMLEFICVVCLCFLSRKLFIKETIQYNFDDDDIYSSLHIHTIYTTVDFTILVLTAGSWPLQVQVRTIHQLNTIVKITRNTPLND